MAQWICRFQRRNEKLEHFHPNLCNIMQNVFLIKFTVVLLCTSHWEKIKWRLLVSVNRDTETKGGKRLCKLQESASSLSYANNNSSVWCDLSKHLLSQTTLSQTTCSITKFPVTWTNVFHIIIKVLIPINNYVSPTVQALILRIFIMKGIWLNGTSLVSRFCSRNYERA